MEGEDKKGNEEEEREWARRQVKRQSVVHAIKSTTEYAEMAYRRGQDRLGTEAPRTPDPRDRRISKRRWEAVAMEWRNAVRHPAETTEISCMEATCAVGVWKEKRSKDAQGTGAESQEEATNSRDSARV